MATRKWFVLVGEDEMGPLGPNGLRKLVRRGEVTAATMVRREDQHDACPAGHLRGLFPHDESAVAQRHGPYQSLRWSSWAAIGTLALCALAGVSGVVTALRQTAVLDRIRQGSALPADAAAPLFGIGAVLTVLLVLVTAVAFVYWLWCARVNLPHLIRARHAYAPSWTVAAWFLPVLNLVRPYQILDEVDRLSAEAHAEGNAAVRAQHLLLLPWWLAALAGTGMAAAYQALPLDTVGDVRTSAGLHLGAGVLATLAAGLCIAIVWRISRLQELAHSKHPTPVRLRHRLHGHGQQRVTWVV